MIRRLLKVPPKPGEVVRQIFGTRVYATAERDTLPIRGQMHDQHIGRAGPRKLQHVRMRSRYQGKRKASPEAGDGALSCLATAQRLAAHAEVEHPHPQQSSPHEPNTDAA